MLLNMSPRIPCCYAKVRRVCWPLIGFLLIGSAGLFSYLQFYLRCSEGTSIKQIETLCSLYYKQEIVGTMCSKLCDENKFQRTQCDGNRWGKKVQIMTCDGCRSPGVISTVVMKAQFDMDEWDRGVHAHYNTTWSSTAPPEEKIAMTVSALNHQGKFFFDTDFSNHPDVISHFLGTDYKQVLADMSSNSALDAVLKTAISLAVQWEYLSVKVLGDKQFVPKVYGTCGQAYFVEYTPSLGKYNYVLFQSKVPDMLTSTPYVPPWEERVEIALKMLKLLVDIEDGYPTPLHMCDIQTHNYGLNDDRDIVLMDSDSVRFESVVPNRTCGEEGCNYLTCHGQCKPDGTCGREMVTNNLQTVCKAIFISKVESLGLLRSAPASIDQRLRPLLQECAYPSRAIFKKPEENKSNRTILREIEDILKESLVVS